MTALSIATAAISFGVGYVAQIFVKATPFDGDPRSVSGTHVLYNVDELRKMNDKERVDAYYNKRADLHDVLEAVVETRDPAQAYIKLKDKKDMQLLMKAIKEFYPKAAVPDAAAPPPAPPAAAVPAPAPIVPPAAAVPAPAPIVPPAEPLKAPMLGGGAPSKGAGHLQFGGEMRPLVLPTAPAAVAVGL
jgi:hypothetical protein